MMAAQLVTFFMIEFSRLPWIVRLVSRMVGARSRARPMPMVEGLRPVRRVGFPEVFGGTAPGERGRSLGLRCTAHVGSWAGLLAVGELVVGDEGGVAHQRANLGEPAGRAQRLVALGEEGRVGLGEVLP